MRLYAPVLAVALAIGTVQPVLAAPTRITSDQILAQCRPQIDSYTAYMKRWLAESVAHQRSRQPVNQLQQQVILDNVAHYQARLNDVSANGVYSQATSGLWRAEAIDWLNQQVGTVARARALLKEWQAQAAEPRGTTSTAQAPAMICQLNMRLNELLGRPIASTPGTLGGVAASGASSKPAAATNLDGFWRGQKSGNQVKIQTRSDGYFVMPVTQNLGQTTNGYLYRGSGGSYRFRFPQGGDSVIQVIGARRIRVTNPDGWTDLFDPIPGR